MSKTLLTMTVAGLLACASSVSSARGSGETGGMGGMLSRHMSTAGMENTNGPQATDRDKGLGRADDRMSQEGLAHEQVTDTHGKKKAVHLNKKHRHSSTKAGDMPR